MATKILERPETAIKKALERAFLPAKKLDFKFEQDRWSTTRSENVEKIAAAWQENPQLVRVFSDPKFGHMQMALLRKDQLEALIKILHDLEGGQAVIKYDIEALFTAAALVQELVENKLDALPADLKPLAKAMSLFLNLWGKVSSTILVQAPQRSVQPSPLSKEEQQALED
jgi:hypothetical protein